MDKPKRLRIVLVCPRIAANVGNVARTAYGLGAELHLVGPLGFRLDPARIKRASVGFWDELNPQIYRDFEHFWEAFEVGTESVVYFATKRGERLYHQCDFGEDVVLVFGNEEEGVDQKFWDYKGLPTIVSCRIPMERIRCFNLGVSVGVIGLEVWRQWGKEGVSQGVESKGKEI